MIVLAKPLIGTIYGNKWSDAPAFLTYSVVYNLLSLFGWRSMGSFLPAMGETKLLLKLSLLTLIISIPLAFLLVPSLGIIGIIIGTPAAALPSTFIALYLIWKHYGAKADFGGSAKILLASVFATVTVYLFLIFFTTAFAGLLTQVEYLILFGTGAILFLAVYLISVPLVGAVNQSDANNLREMLSGLGILSRLLEIPLKIIDKLLKIRN
jgi:O-antigen/teichoic acid export membrane protein